MEFIGKFVCLSSKILPIDFLFFSHVESGYLNTDMCKFE